MRDHARDWSEQGAKNGEEGREKKGTACNLLII